MPRGYEMERSRHSVLPLAVLLLATAAMGGEEPPPRRFEMSKTAIIGTRSERSVFDAPQSTSVVDLQEMRMRQSRTTPEALQEETGILVQETTFGGGSPFLRGQVGNRILLLIDGIRLNNSTYRFGPNQFLNTVDAFGLDRIEVVRGPASVLYGSDALGGAINVIPRRRLDFSEPFDVDALLLTRFGSAAFEKTLRTEVQGNRGRFGFYGGATARDFDDLRAGEPTGRQDHTGYHEVDGDARIELRLTPGQHASFFFQRVTQLEVPNRVAFENDDEELFFDPQERSLYVLEHVVENALPWLARVRSNLSLHDQNEIRKRRDFGSPVRREESDRVETLGFTTQADVPVSGEHLVVTGFEAWHDHVDSSSRTIDPSSPGVAPGGGSFPDGSTYDTLAVYGQATIELLPPLSLIGGARYSRFSLDADVGGTFGRVTQDFDDVTGAVSLVYRVLPGLSVVGTFSQGFRAPNLDDTVVLRAVPEQNGIDAPNPGLEPETVDNFELGLKAHFARASGSVFAYFSSFSNLIERAPGAFEGRPFLDENGNGTQDANEPTVFTKQNVGDAEVYGIELDFELEATRRLEAFGNLSWVRGENTTADEPFRRIPPILGRAGLRWFPTAGGWWLEYFSRVAGEQDRLSSGDRSDSRIPPGGTPGWQTQNLRGGWQATDSLNLTLGVENLTDEQYRLHGSGIDAPGVNVLATAELTF